MSLFSSPPMETWERLTNMKVAPPQDLAPLENQTAWQQLTFRANYFLWYWTVLDPTSGQPWRDVESKREMASLCWCRHAVVQQCSQHLVITYCVQPLSWANGGRWIASKLLLAGSSQRDSWINEGTRGGYIIARGDQGGGEAGLNSKIK